MNRYNEEEVKQHKARIISVAQEMLGKQIGLIEGGRKLAALSLAVGTNKLDEDFVIFVALASETDHLPVGDERKYWANAALVEKDKEIVRIESAYEKEILAACRKLIAKFA